MSGPKVQIYKLRGKERENALAQLRCDAQSARYASEIDLTLKELTEAGSEIETSLKLLRKLNEVYGGREKEIAEAEETKRVLEENLEELKKLFRKYRPAQRRYVFTDSELKKREDRMDRLKEICSSVRQLKKQADKASSAGMDEIRKRRDDAVSVLTELQSEGQIPRQTAEQLRKSVEDYFSSSAGMTEDEGLEKQKKSLRQSLEACGAENISPRTAEAVLSALSRLEKTDDMKMLKSFRDITVTPLIRKAAAEKAQYNEKLAYLKTLYEMAQMPFPGTSYDTVGEDTAKMEKMLEEQQEKEYIARCTDEVMKEMGYELIGEKETVRKSGRRFRSELYHFSEGTAVNVTYDAEGKISMEIGGIAEDDRLPDAAETAALVNAMGEFCAEFEVFERKMAERGIIVGSRIAKLPPAPQHASLINVSDYEMIRSAGQLKDRRRMLQQTRGMQRKDD